MYNSIHPINITYRNPRQSSSLSNPDAQNYEQTPVSYENGSNGRSNREFPNGTKVAIDYTKNTVNISQIVTDFKSTVIAIGAPEDISNEVNSYLALVEKESQKANPSREIIFSNLINASKISDAYIHQELSKKNGNAPKNVVEGWIDALFKQRVELKADSTHINPDFQLDIPDKKRTQQVQQPQTQASQDEFKKAQPFAREIPAEDLIEPQSDEDFSLLVQDEVKTQDEAVYDEQNLVQSQQYFESKKQIKNDDVIEFRTIEPVKSNVYEPEIVEALDIAPVQEVEHEVNIVQEKKSKKPYYVTNEHDRVLYKSLKDAKAYLTLDDDPALALETVNNALGEVNSDTNKNLRAALHFERGKIFDDYDYVNYALRDYYEATKCDDDNLKSQAHLRMARIYDDYVDFEPAVDHYQDALAYSGEASNLRAQTKILGEMASMFSGRYDLESTQMLSNLAIESAKEVNDPILLSKTYSSAARNYEYLGEDFRALDNFKNAVKAIEGFDDDYETYNLRAQNYEDAADVMDRLGNVAKSESLLSKARLYRQRAQLENLSEAV